jgi:hypothetical protein
MPDTGDVPLVTVAVQVIPVALIVVAAEQFTARDEAHPVHHIYASTAPAAIRPRTKLGDRPKYVLRPSARSPVLVAWRPRPTHGKSWDVRTVLEFRVRHGRPCGRQSGG